MAHMRCILDKQGYIHARVCASPSTRTPTRTHARARTHRQICNSYCFVTATMIRERASMLRYTYIVCIFSESVSCMR